MGKCMRIPPTTNPVIDVNSKDMTCSEFSVITWEFLSIEQWLIELCLDVGGEDPVARACPIVGEFQYFALYQGLS